MSTIAFFGWWAACLAVTFWRSERQFRIGYLKALDHVEELARTASGPLGLKKAIATLREEMGVQQKGDAT